MENSKIQWTDHTWNIAVGCRKVDADCKFCYMYRGSLNGTRYDPKEIRKTKRVFTLPLRIKDPSRIFVSSLTDVFLEEIDAYRGEMWDIIRKCPQHTFQILTKRPERIAQCLPPDWGAGWDNVWLGTSIGSQESDARMVALAQVPAKIRFLSVEPLHGPVDLSRPVIENHWGEYNALAAFHWIIVGGESGNENGKYRYRPCELNWIEEIIETGAGFFRIPIFVKQLGTHLAKQLRLKDRHGGDMEEWPQHLRIRQFPKNAGITENP